jgi:hypothetical protein
MKFTKPRHSPSFQKHAESPWLVLGSELGGEGKLSEAYLCINSMHVWPWARSHLKSGNVAEGRKELTVLELDAKARGFILIARKAARLRQPS